MKQIGIIGGLSWHTSAVYYRLRDQYGLKVLLPDGPDEENVHHAIYDELTRGIVSESSRARLRAAIDHLAERGAEGVILGCTELMLLVSAEDSAVPLFDTTRLHVDAAVDFALRSSQA